MIRTLLLIIVMGLASTISAQEKESLDLNALYQQIDDAISQSPQYVAKLKQQLAACQDSFLMEKSAEKRILMAEKLFRLYEPYRNDSALHYAELCITLADSLRRPDLSGRFRSMLAYQCSTANMYSESLELLRTIDKSALDNTGLIDYYNAWMHVCGEIGSYTQRKDVRHHYFDLQNHYRDSVLMVAEEGSEKWFHLKMDVLSARRLYQDALELSNQWLEKVTDNTHESAYAAFYRSMVYDNLNNHEMVCYWLGKSALDDIKCAVMNQASLLFLAEHLADDGDISRARRYVEFAKECNLAFCPRMRFYQVNPVINVIEKSSQATQSKANLILIVAIAAIVFLLLALFYVFSLMRKAKRKE
ncbi:MAG: hypothetical protein J6T44_00325 [Prevotella sp.]|nr:hypothetical protein [Prevotella sp.]MBO7537706.1 hypothetical protein [Prevotella sp.]